MMVGNLVDKWLDKDWQKAHAVDRLRLPCEVVHIANAELIRSRQ